MGNGTVAIVVAVIGAVATITVAFINAGIDTIKVARNTQGLQPKNYRKQQLDDIFAPLELILFYDPTLSSACNRIRIRSILDANFALMPPVLVSALMPCCTELPLPDGRAEHAAIVTSSFYNWTRKSLKYPSDQSKIKMEYTPISERDILTQKAIKQALKFLWWYSLFIAFVVFISGSMDINKFQTMLPLEVVLVGAFYYLKSKYDRRKAESNDYEQNKKSTGQHHGIHKN